MVEAPQADAGRSPSRDQIGRRPIYVITLIDERLLARWRCDPTKEKLGRPDGDGRAAAGSSLAAQFVAATDRTS
jgi:hypothetical protein